MTCTHKCNQGRACTCEGHMRIDTHRPQMIDPDVDADLEDVVHAVVVAAVGLAVVAFAFGAFWVLA